MNPKPSLVSLLHLATTLTAGCLVAATGLGESEKNKLPIVGPVQERDLLPDRVVVHEEISPSVFDIIESPAGAPRPDDNDSQDDSPDDWIPSYDCEGSVMCDTMALRWCDDAVNYHLQRADDVLYGTDLPKVGACAGWATLGCGVIIQGGGCNRTGNQMWWDYQDIRKVGHCSKCGTKHWYPGCMTTIAYLSWCNSDKLDHK